MALSLPELYAFYDNVTFRVIPGPRSFSYFAFLLLLPSALLIPPATLSHRQLGICFLPMILACEMHAWRQSAALDVISITVLQWSFVLLVCHDPRRSFRRTWLETTVSMGPEQKRETRFLVKEQAYQSHKFIERLAWVFTLLVSIRLTGWKIGDVLHDSKQPHPRTVSKVAFLKRACSTMLLSYLLLDISTCYTRMDPYFTTSVLEIDTPFLTNAPVGSFMHRFLRYLPPRLVRSAIIASQLYSIVAGGFYPLTFPVVTLCALGLLPNEWSPHTWPNFFGPFSAIRTKGLRGLWGSWWHQMNRQINATPGRLLSDHLRLQEGWISRKMIVTTVAFGLSGWMHMGMIPPYPKSKKMTPTEMRLSVAGFFWIQPLGFAVEYLVVMVRRKTAPNLKFGRAAEFLTLLWVSAWLCLTLPMLTAPFRELGYWKVSPIPFSILDISTGNGWSRSSKSFVGD